MVIREKRGFGRWRLCFYAAASALLLSSAKAAAKRVVWIDTDPSIGSPIRDVDDAFALVLAFHSPELTIAGISTSYGNAPLRSTTRIARQLVRHFSKRDLPVYAGARSAGELGRATAATDGLRAALEKGDRVTYLALAPLTNLATFQMLHPTLARRIERVIFVGGQTSKESLRFGPGRGFRIHDANVFKDSIAVARVLHAKVPIALAPVDNTSPPILDAADFHRLREGGLAANFLYRKSKVWFWFWRNLAREKGGPLFDAAPVLAVIRPELVPLQRRGVRLDVQGRLLVVRYLTSTSREVDVCSLAAPAKVFIVERLCR